MRKHQQRLSVDTTIIFNLHKTLCITSSPMATVQTLPAADKKRELNKQSKQHYILFDRTRTN